MADLNKIVDELPLYLGDWRSGPAPAFRDDDRDRRDRYDPPRDRGGFGDRDRGGFGDRDSKLKNYFEIINMKVGFFLKMFYLLKTKPMIVQDMVVVDIQMIEVDHNIFVIHNGLFLKIKNEQKILAISN